MLGWWRASAVAETRLDLKIAAIRENDVRLERELAEAVTDLKNVALELRGLSKGQDVINVMMNKALESMVAKLERHDHTLAEQTTNITIIRALMVQDEDRRRNGG